MKVVYAQHVVDFVATFHSNMIYIVLIFPTETSTLSRYLEYN